MKRVAIPMLDLFMLLLFTVFLKSQDVPDFSGELLDLVTTEDSASASAPENALVIVLGQDVTLHIAGSTPLLNPGDDDFVAALAATIGPVHVIVLEDAHPHAMFTLRERLGTTREVDFQPASPQEGRL